MVLGPISGWVPERPRLKHILLHPAGGPKYQLLARLTSALCLRITQAARLSAADFVWKCKAVYVGNFKGHDSTHKKLAPSDFAYFKKVYKVGLRAPPIRIAAGARGTKVVTRKFAWLVKGPLFPSRRGAKLRHLSKDTVVHAMAKISKYFVARYAKVWPDLLQKQPRSHSGRRHAISRLLAAGVSDVVVMQWAQITSPAVFRTYCDMHYEEIGAILAAVDDKLRRKTK